MGRAGLDADVIKRGYLWSLATLACMWGLIGLYFACLGVELNGGYVFVQITQTLLGMTIQAMLTMCEYVDHKQALALQSEARPLLP